MDGCNFLFTYLFIYLSLSVDWLLFFVIIFLGHRLAWSEGGVIVLSCVFGCYFCCVIESWRKRFMLSGVRALCDDECCVVVCCVVIVLCVLCSVGMCSLIERYTNLCSCCCCSIKLRRAGWDSMLCAVFLFGRVLCSVVGNCI